MVQGQKLSDWQIQEIRATWLLTRNGSEAARIAGCHAATANRYIASHREELAQLAQDKKPELSDVVRHLLERTLSVAFDGKKLADASFGQIVTGVGILVDKYQLLTGEATERHEHRDVDEARESVARRLDELALRRRAKAADLVADGAASG